MGPQVHPKCFRHPQHMKNNWELRKRGYLIRFGHKEDLLLKKYDIKRPFFPPCTNWPICMNSEWSNKGNNSPPQLRVLFDEKSAQTDFLSLWKPSLLPLCSLSPLSRPTPFSSTSRSSCSFVQEGQTQQFPSFLLLFSTTALNAAGELGPNFYDTLLKAPGPPAC